MMGIQSGQCVDQQSGYTLYTDPESVGMWSYGEFRKLTRTNPPGVLPMGCGVWIVMGKTCSYAPGAYLLNSYNNLANLINANQCGRSPMLMSMHGNVVPVSKSYMCAGNVWCDITWHPSIWIIHVNHAWNINQHFLDKFKTAHFQFIFHNSILFLTMPY
jgi:hypothetical protein